jgi:hypothetical protein
MLEFWPPGWTGVVFRRELIDQIGPLDTEVGHALDLDYLYRVAAHFPIAVSLQPGALWVAHAASASVESPLDGVWPGWLKMIQNLTDNQEIPLEVKELATRKLTARLKRLLFTDSGWLAVLGGRCEEAQRSAEILKQHFREERKAALLRFLVRIQLAFSPFGKLVLMMLAGRRKLREIWNADYRRQRIPYLAYVKYLDLT